MNRFLVEAALIGCKEGMKIALCVVPVFALLRASGRDTLRRPLVAGLATVFVLSFLVMGMEVSVALRAVTVKMVGYTFGLFYLFSLATLFHGTGVDLLGPLARPLRSASVLMPVLFLLTLLYFLPDMTASSLYVADTAMMAGGSAVVRIAAGTGFAVALPIAWRVLRRFDQVYSNFLGVPQALLSLALIKLLAGGVKGFAELSLIPSVQAGLMKLVHDIVHQVLVLLLMPDHPILSTTTWNFIGVLFGQKMGLALSLVIVTVPLAIFVVRHLSEVPPPPAELTVPAQRRIFLRAIRDRRLLKSAPIFVFLTIIVSVWFSEKGEGPVKLYAPDPLPAVATAGIVSIPIETPGADLRDGMVHKYVVMTAGQSTRLLILKKPDGKLSVCLDACEICPPDGYGQSGEQVICVYCNTPIPIDTLGKEGGCNPIPLKAEVTDRDVRISLTEISEKWKKIQSGGTPLERKP